MASVLVFHTITHTYNMAYYSTARYHLPYNRTKLIFDYLNLVNCCWIVSPCSKINFISFSMVVLDDFG